MFTQCENVCIEMLLLFLFRPGAFLGLESLEWLKINGNALTELPTQGLFPRSLKVSYWLVKGTLLPIFKQGLYRHSDGGPYWRYSSPKLINMSEEKCLS